jgi:hypothetical protein
MDWNLILGISGVAFGLIGLAYAIYVTRRNRQVKLLAYEILSPMPIAHVMSRNSAYSLRIVYEKAGESPITIDRAVIHFIRFTNFGHTAIRREDVAGKDKLRLVVKGGTILDLSLSSVTRDVCGIVLGETRKIETEASAIIELDFLDHKDGALIQIVTDSKDSAVSLQGTIIGMPKGIRQIMETDREAMVSGWGCVPAAALQLVAIATVPLLYLKIAGTLNHVWLLLLPIGALVLPAALTILMASILNPLRSYQFPKLLTTPNWYRGRARAYGIGSPSAKKNIDKRNIDEVE